jgi:predicted nucleotidyltransferase
MQKNPLNEISPIKRVLNRLRRQGRIKIALLYGSYAEGKPHKRSDIDLAVLIPSRDQIKREEITNEILMASETPVSLLLLDDEDESPFVVQEALKGTHLVAPDWETFYARSHWALHEAEGIRFRRAANVK